MKKPFREVWWENQQLREDIQEMLTTQTKWKLGLFWNLMLVSAKQSGLELFGIPQEDVSFLPELCPAICENRTNCWGRVLCKPWDEGSVFQTFSPLKRDPTAVHVFWPLKHTNRICVPRWLGPNSLSYNGQKWGPEMRWLVQGHKELGLEPGLLRLPKRKCINCQDGITGVGVKQTSSTACRLGEVPPRGTSGFWQVREQRPDTSPPPLSPILLIAD